MVFTSTTAACTRSNLILYKTYKESGNFQFVAKTQSDNTGNKGQQRLEHSNQLFASKTRLLTLLFMRVNTCRLLLIIIMEHISGRVRGRDGNRSGRDSLTGRSSRSKNRSNSPFLQLKYT